MEEHKENSNLMDSDILEELTARELNDKIASLSVLKCIKCQNVLRPPIVLVRSVGNVCGTCCENFDDTLTIHNEALQIILQYVVLPCKYETNGCDRRFGFSAISDHELVCKYRNFSCPMKSLENCTWTQSLTLLVEHFKEKHNDAIVNSLGAYLTDIDITKNSKSIKLLNYNDNLFIFHFRYSIYNSMFRCIFYRIQNESKPFELDCCMLKLDGQVARSRNFEHKDFNGHFRVNKRLSVKLLPANRGESKRSICIFMGSDENIPSTLKIDEKMLKVFECPVCNNYMRAPIFQCIVGHSVCNICKSKLESCPLCRGTFSNTRNYCLENISNDMYFPCMYRKHGCTVFEPGATLVKHEEQCTAKAYSCPHSNGCIWKGMYDEMLVHIRNHPNVTKDNYHLENITSSAKDIKFYLIAYNRLFCASINLRSALSAGISRGIVTNWGVYLIGPKGEARLFKREFGLINRNSVDRKLVFINICQDMPKNLNTFSGSLEISHQIINEYVNNETLTFYCKIIKMVDTDHKKMLCNQLKKPPRSC